MGTAAAVLRALKEAREGWVSGEVLAASLGVSRNAIWKAVASLRASGYEVDGSARRGYRLAAIPDRPLPEEVLPGLPADAFGKGLGYRLHYFPELSSTNDRLRQLSRAGAPEGTVVVAERQTAGRGRRGRTWESPGDLGLWFSVLLRPPRPVREAPLLALLAAAAVRAGAAETAGVDGRIKWPNDVIVAQGKVCGVLAELEAEVDRIRACILGVGVNVNQTAHDFPIELAGKAASLRMAAGRSLRRVPLLQSILHHLARRYRRALEVGFGPLLEEVRAQSATLGQRVLVEESGRAWTGLAEDLTADGALSVRPDTGGETVTVYAADVSIRSG